MAGHLANIWQLHLNFTFSKNTLTLTLVDLACVFNFCPNLTHLTIKMVTDQGNKNQTHADLVEQLIRGFRRLECMELSECLPLFLSSWLYYKEILT